MPARKVRVNSWYRWYPVGHDLFAGGQGPRGILRDGQRVKVINKFGCPPANTMGHCYVETEAGEFAGLVLCNSLVPDRHFPAKETA